MSTREVELTGGAPWGFRMHGGADQNQPLRISRVNPGRKASLSGIREGDVISSINGRPTKSMSNADAHAMLRSAGPVLRLGLNEDREMSPRRRSIGKSSELKRPSQLIAEAQKATPQAPVYATIRPSHSPHNRPSSSHMRSSLNSLPSALNSTPLVKSVASTEEPLRFHPTNPFYTTLPSNYSSASKLPVPNGRAPLSEIDRTKSKDTCYSVCGADLKSPSYFTITQDSGPSSLPYINYNNTENINGYESGTSKSTADNKDNFSHETKFNSYDPRNQGLPNNRNPFETKRNSDPFVKYLRPESTKNGKPENETIPNSVSDSNFFRNEEITKRSTITEHKISEMEEVKTIKKIILNGSSDTSDYQNDDDKNFSSSAKNIGTNKFDFKPQQTATDYNFTSTRNEYVHTPTQSQNDYVHVPTKSKNEYVHTSTHPRNEYVHIPTQPKNEYVYTPTQSRNEYVHTPTQSRTEYLHTPTQSKNEYVHTPTQSRNEYMQTPTQPRNEYVHTPNQSRNDCVHTPTQSRNECVHTPSQPKNEFVYTPTQSRNEYVLTPTQQISDKFNASCEQKEQDGKFSTYSYQSTTERNNSYTTAEAPASDVVASKPPVKSPTFAPAPVSSPTPKPVWRPGAPTPPPAPTPVLSPRSPGAPPPPPPPPVWTPGSAGPSPQPPKKTFRPVHFEETPPSLRKFANSEQNGCTSGSESEGRLRTSLSAPASGLHSLGGSSSRLPRAQNPTVTLLQKAREGQIPRGANYLQQERDPRLPRDRPSPPKGDPVYALRKEYASEGEADRSDYERGGIRKMADAHRKVEGIGPTTKDGMPVALRSEVKDPSRWYKKMYDTIHKNKYDDDYVTIRYKSRRGQPPQRVSNKSQYAYFDPRSGYLSEPEGGLSRLGSSTWSDAYDSDVTTGPRRRTASVQEDRRNNDVTSLYLPSNKYSTLASARASQEVYKNQPGRIENYVPGKSSVVDKEAKQWWDEVMDIFDGQNISSTTSLPQASPKEKKDITSAILSKSNMARALKESGYESDSTLVFRRRDDTEPPLSPAERRAAYRDLQAGGEPPLKGFRSPAPPRQDESEIEYIPITSTLTKIRVHKKTPKLHEVICYPVTRIEPEAQTKFKKHIPSFITVDVPCRIADYPPAPPRRVSSKNSRTLKLVTSTRPVSTSPKRSTSVHPQSNVDFLRDKISHKLSRQNTHIITKRGSVPDTKITTAHKSAKSRIMSASAPPAVNRKNVVTPPRTFIKNLDNKAVGTSSFGSPRRTMLPTEYSLPNKYSDSHSSVVIEGGAGRRTPISNILDKVTSLDKLWGSERRNERIDLAKAKAKSIMRTNYVPTSKSNTKHSDMSTIKSSPTVTHKSRDMTRTAEKLQKLKISNVHAKSNPCLTTKAETKIIKPGTLQTSSNISKSFLNISSTVKKQNQIRTAVVTNLKKKKSLESVILRPRSVPCHESCSKKSKDTNKNAKKSMKTKTTKKITSRCCNDSDLGSQFGDTSNEASNFSSYENLRKKGFSSKEMEMNRDAVVSDSFFQHLFFGNTCIPTISYPILEPNTSVLQKAKMFQSYPQDNITPKSLNTYLIHRKPVSLSRFKIWDRYSSPVRAQSPRSISWPGRTHGEIRKFDSLSKYEDFGSTSSLATVRSKSEPPVNKMYFSQTSRPKSPIVLFYKKSRESPVRKETSPSRFVFSQTSRPMSPKVTRKIEQPSPQYGIQSQSPTRLVFTETIRPISPTVTKRAIPKIEVIEVNTNEDKKPSTMFFSQTSRPVSPKVIKKSTPSTSLSRSQSTSPVSVRSPSYRRIHGARLHTSKYFGDAMTKGVLRTRSAGDADKKIPQDNLSLKTKSDSNLRADDPDYEEYIIDMQNTKIRSERFRELNRYYAYLERVAELEKTTSTSDLRHRRKDEEIIDFDRWKKIRAIERAEEELNNLYYKLKLAQNENDVLFYPRDIKDFRWNHDTDRGLRIKEKSVEDLKDHFQQISYYDSIEVEHAPLKDTYKPLWRGTSVAETAFHINRKNENKNEMRTATLKPTVILHQDSSLSELRKKIGLGNRLWSSLSMEQVNALKNQLNAIYSKELESKTNKESENFSVDVKDTQIKGKPTLHVRCNSLITSPYVPMHDKELSKSESIAAISCPITSVKELKNNVNKIQMSLSENEKRKISQTLSKEVLDRINKFDNATPLTLKQEIENSLIDQYSTEDRESPPLLSNERFNEPKPQEDNDKANDEQARHVVYPVENTEIQYQQSSASETETGSSDVSSKTVIYRGPKKEVKKKVEYFESVKNMSDQTNTIYHARENSDEKEKQDKLCNKLSTSFDANKLESPKNQIVQSQSCTNFKELFGESEKNKFLSLPSKPELYSRSPSPHSEVHVTDRRTPDTLRYSSDETIWRSRSPSPDPERYWRAYLNLARAGEVRRLARRFDSPSAAGAVLRRHRSDPELSRNILHNKWPSDERLSPRREKIRGVISVARVPLRPTNRYMPHIDVISKLASLHRRNIPRSRSAEEASECRTGEVNRIRRRFEAMSLLGQIYASAPDVSELRDIAPYLAGSWIAHRYPNRCDNNRSLQDPAILNRGRTSPIKKEIKRLVCKEPVKLSSILKNDIFAKQVFDPLAHRPASRYEPPRAPPRPPPASWPYRLAPYVTPSRHTVTFQG